MFVPPPSDSRVSPDAVKLAQNLSSVIQEFRATHPSIRTDEIRQAIRLAAVNTGVDTRRQAAIFLVAGLLVLGVLFALLFSMR